ncbi:hypothetical protein [Mucilaginibacter hurinus]|nr:hypothetical protein [Mucilaginibacter hurinus]
MKKSILILTAITTLFLGACKKDKDNKPGGGDTYQPFTKNSVWKYRNTIKVLGNTITDTTTNTMTDTVKTFNGKKFYVVTSADNSDTSSTYIGLNNNVYSTYIEAGDEGVLEIAYLNDTKAVGESWETTATMEIEGEEVEAKIKTTIVEKGISKTILDKAYNNVIHTKVELQVKLGENFQTLSTSEYFVAKNVGIIGNYVKQGGVEVSKSELFNYTIK